MSFSLGDLFSDASSIIFEKMGFINRRRKSQVRGQWRAIVKEAKVRHGL
jgi:hypothetical protein